jgi:hypothetical protein
MKLGVRSSELGVFSIGLSELRTNYSELLRGVSYV